jgi:uncharacterized protein (DUF58 family)
VTATAARPAAAAAPSEAARPAAAPAAPRRARERRALSRRINDWLESRLQPSDTCTLTQRNIYILPTQAGWSFGAMLLVMLIGSINYQLNLGYVLTFLLAGSGAVSMHLPHGTLRGLTLHLRPAAPVFAGEPARLEIVLTNPGHQRHGLAVHFHDRAAHGPSFAWCDVPALGTETVRLSTVPPVRGWHGVATLVVSSSFPLGLFRAWTVWRPAGRVLAWPRPERPAPPLPAAAVLSGEETRRQRVQGGELDGVRAWRRGDTLRQVAWKKVARSGEMVSRETAGSGRQQLCLDWSAASVPGLGGDVEARLSRLTAWVLLAEREGLTYSVRLPGRDLPPGHGDAQRRAALDTLAQWS